MKKRYLTLAAALAVAPFLGVTSAEATPVKIQATVLGPVRIDPGDASVAWLTAKYLCQPGPEEVQWLWVSAKQVESAAPDQRLRDEGSTQYASAWIQAHPLGEFTCDGAWHTDTFRISTDFDPVNGGGFGALKPGAVWVQFCLFDGQENFESYSRWAAAV